MPEPCPLCGGKTMILSAPHASHSMVSDGRLMYRPLTRRSCLDCGAASRADHSSDKEIKAIYGYDYALPRAAPLADVARGRAYAAWIMEQVSPPRALLEVGCGSGAMLTTLLERWPNAIGTGIDPALPNGALANDRLCLYRGFIDDLPDPKSSFDLIVAINVIEHTRDPKEFLVALKSRLSPNGRIVIICPAAEPPNMELLFYDHLFSLTLQSLDRIAASVHLTIEKTLNSSAALGDFQMAVLTTGLPPNATERDDISFAALASARNSYFASWRDLDRILLERAAPGRSLAAFGAGQTACLLRVYAPNTWARVETVVVDDVREAWNIEKPIERYSEAMSRLCGADILIATAPRVQGKLAARLESDGLRPIRYDDLIDS